MIEKIKHHWQTVRWVVAGAIAPDLLDYIKELQQTQLDQQEKAKKDMRIVTGSLTGRY